MWYRLAIAWCFLNWPNAVLSIVKTLILPFVSQNGSPDNHCRYSLICLSLRFSQVQVQPAHCPGYLDIIIGQPHPHNGFDVGVSEIPDDNWWQLQFPFEYISYRLQIPFPLHIVPTAPTLVSLWRFALRSVLGFNQFKSRAVCVSPTRFFWFRTYHDLVSTGSPCPLNLDWLLVAWLVRLWWVVPSHPSNRTPCQ